MKLKNRGSTAEFAIVDSLGNIVVEVQIGPDINKMPMLVDIGGATQAYMIQSTSRTIPVGLRTRLLCLWPVAIVAWVRRGLWSPIPFTLVI